MTLHSSTMEWLFRGLLLSGLFTQSIQQGFVLIQELKTWNAAQAYCRLNHVDLATAQNNEDWTDLQNTVQPALSSVAWIGLNNDMSSWEWSYKDEKISFTNWSPGEPGNSLYEKCIVMISGRWYDWGCASNVPVLCYNEKGIGANRFVYYSGVWQNWHAARSYCRQHYTDMAIVQNQTDNDQLASKLPTNVAAWIGLHKGWWKWSDGTQTSTSPISWMTGKPDMTGINQPCGAAGPDGLIDDWYCLDPLPFICKLHAKRQIVRVEVRSGLNVNDPAVMNIIFNWINLKLMDHGIKITTLRYRVQPDGNVFSSDEALAGLFTESLQHGYVIIQEKNTWDEAQAYCRLNHVDLATVQSTEDWTDFQNTIQLALTSVAWIGLNNDISSWEWSYKNEKISFANWNPGEPGSSLYEKCVVMISGHWYDWGCAQNFPTLCYNEKAIGANRFVYYSGVWQNWHAARSYCRQHYTDMAIVRNQTDNDQLASILPTNVAAWIGLYKGWWTWSDGTQTSTSPISWMTGKPDMTGINQPCGAAGPDGLIDDWYCSDPLPFICKRYVKRQIVRVEVKSGLNVNDPAVMRIILKSISQKLMDHGIKISTLRYRVQPSGNVFLSKHSAEKTKNCSNFHF